MRAQVARSTSVGAWAAALLVAWTGIAQAEPVQPLSVARPPYLVSSSRELPALMKDDSLLGPRANNLVAQQHRAITAVAVGGGAAVVLGAIGMIAEQDDCFGSGFTRQCQKQPNWTILGVAGGVFAVGLLVGVMLMPSDNLVNLVNAWNLAHPDRPLGIAPATYEVSNATPP
jgi:hypothetical protein